MHLNYITAHLMTVFPSAAEKQSDLIEIYKEGKTLLFSFKQPLCYCGPSLW